MPVVGLEGHGDDRGAFEQLGNELARDRERWVGDDRIAVARAGGQELDATFAEAGLANVGRDDGVPVGGKDVRDRPVAAGRLPDGAGGEGQEGTLYGQEVGEAGTRGCNEAPVWKGRTCRMGLRALRVRKVSKRWLATALPMRTPIVLLLRRFREQRCG